MSRGFLLDTNIPSDQVNSRPEPSVRDWIDAQHEETLFISVLTIGELRKGIVLLAASKRRAELEVWLEGDLVPQFSGRILPVTQAVADRWGTLDAQRQLRGAPLDIADGLIAATALEHGLTLITRNVKDFAHLDLTMLNPWTRP